MVFAEVLLSRSNRRSSCPGGKETQQNNDLKRAFENKINRGKNMSLGQGK